MPNMNNLSSTGLSRSSSLGNKFLFDKFPILVIGSCDVDITPHIFLTRENQDIQEINIHFDGKLNHFGPMVFAENQEQNWSYNFKDVLL